jgi:hypothetical protein
MNGALVAAVYQALTERKGAISLPVNGEHESSETAGKEAIDNPLADVDIPPRTLAIMFAVAIGGSIVSANVFTVRLLCVLRVHADGSLVCDWARLTMSILNYVGGNNILFLKYRSVICEGTPNRVQTQQLSIYLLVQQQHQRLVIFNIILCRSSITHRYRITRGTLRVRVKHEVFALSASVGESSR